MSVSTRRVVNTSILPQSVELGPQQVQGITVDNYSGFWIRVGNDLYVPPRTLGWASNLLSSAAGGLGLTKSVPSAYVTNPSSASGQDDILIVSIYDNYVSPSIGIPVMGVVNWDFNSESAIAAGSITYATPSGLLFRKGMSLRMLNLTAFITGGTAGRIDVRVTDGILTTTLFTAVVNVGQLLEVDYPASISKISNSPAGATSFDIVIRTADLAGVNSWTYAYNAQWS